MKVEMRIASFYLIVPVLLINAFIQSATAISGTATYYTLYNSSACYGYDDQGTMVAAANDAIYSNGSACGTFYNITCTNSTNQGGSCKSGNSVTVKIVDSCPSCAANQFDLSEQAFSQIADTAAGKIDIDYNNMETFRTSPSTGAPAKENGSESTVIGIVTILITATIFIALFVCCASTQKTFPRKLPGADPSSLNTTRKQGGNDLAMVLAKNKLKSFTSQKLREYTHNGSIELGSGGWGKVLKGELPNGHEIAVKVLHERPIGPNERNQFIAEVETLGRTYHKNLVKLYGYCSDPSYTALVFEYLKNGSLDKHLFNKEQVIEWKKLCDIAIGTARGLAYLHEECPKRIIHYDIKPGNILLDDRFLPKVADFGLAKLYNRDDTHNSLADYRGTRGYFAPEIYTRAFPITHKCDVYSFGMVLFEIVGRRRNIIEGGSNDSLNWLPKKVSDGYGKDKLSNIIMECGIKKEHKEKAEKMFLIALCCVQYDPKDRPTMSGVVKMLEGEMKIPRPTPFRTNWDPQIGINPARSPVPFTSDDMVSPTATTTPLPLPSPNG